MINWLFTQTPLAFFIQDFWRDEAFSYLLAKKSFLQIIYLSLKDFSPPLYDLLLKIWMTFTGSSEIALRSLSLVFFILLLFTAFHFCLDVFKFSERISLLAMLLFFINPLLLYYAFEARGYSMFAFLSLLSFYALLTNKKRVYMIATIAGLYTHYFMIFAVVAQVIYGRWQSAKDYGDRLRWMHVSLLSSLPWIFVALILKVFTSTQFWIDKVRLHDLFYLPAVVYTGYEKSFSFPHLNPFRYPTFLLLISLILFLTTAIAYLKLKKNSRQLKSSLFILLLLWSVVPPVIIFLVSFIKPLYLPRYLIFCTPGLILLTIHSLKFLKNPAKIVLLGLIVILTLYYNNLQIHYRKKSHVSTTIREMTALIGPNDSIYVPNELDYFIVLYYSKSDKVYIYAKDYSHIPEFVGKVLIPKDKVRSTLPSYPARAFVYRESGYEIQTLY